MAADDSQDTRIDRGPGGHGPPGSPGDNAPRRLGRYEAVRILGRGGMGSVYLAEDRVIGRQVAIKEIRVEAGVSEAARAEQRLRFEVELRAAGRLSHPNIATVYDAFETDDAYCIALEYVPGISLDERLRTGPPFTAAGVADLAAQTAAGLDYAHRRGIVHRDVKPGNVLLSEEGVVKLTDFGIAKLLSLEVTQTGIALGTPAYMSPEQIQGRPLDGRSDQFSLAVMLYRVLAGRLPFDGDSPHTMLYRIVQAEPERPSALASALPPAVDAVLLRALAKEPDARYPDCATLARELAAALAMPAMPVAPPPAVDSQAPTMRTERPATAPFEAAPRPPRRVLPWALGCALLLVVGLMVAAYVMVSSLDREPRGSRSAPPAVSPSPAVPSPVPAPEESPPEPTPAVPEESPAPRPAAPGPVAVEITSEPGRCRVSIDGRHAGFTPLTRTLKPGRHELTCDWPGGGTQRVEATVSPSRRRFRFQL